MSLASGVIRVVGYRILFVCLIPVVWWGWDWTGSKFGQHYLIPFGVILCAGLALVYVVAKTRTASSGSARHAFSDITAKSLTLKPHGLLSSSYTLASSQEGAGAGQQASQRAIQRADSPNDPLGELSPDIDLGKPRVLSNGFLCEKSQLVLNRSASSNEDVLALQETLLFRKLQIDRLEQVLVNLKEYEEQIDKFRTHLPSADKAIYDSVLDEIQLQQVSDDLQALISRQSIRILNQSTISMDATSWQDTKS